MYIWWIFYVYIALAIVAATLYTPKFAQLSRAFRRPPKASATARRKIAIVIPARNESAVIGELFRSVERQDYDKNFFEIFVIVKERSDPTVRICDRLGISVTVAPEQTCKGEALDAFFQSIDRAHFRSFDAFAIVDADAVLSPDYLSRLNDALEYDRDIFVTRKNIKNFLGDETRRTLTTDCCALVYPVIDELGNAYRSEKNVPLTLCGQGLMVRRRVIEKIGGWPYRTLTEDYELKMDSVLKGFASMYYPHAVIYTEEVLSHRDSYRRRVRWLTGYSQCDRKYKKEVRKRLKYERAPRAARFDFQRAILVPAFFLVLTALVSLAGIGISITLAARGSGRWAFPLALLTCVPIGVLYLLLFLYAALAMLSYRDALTTLPVREKLMTLLVMPFFLLEFIPAFLKSRRAARKRANDWVQPARVGLSDAS